MAQFVVVLSVTRKGIRKIHVYGMFENENDAKQAQYMVLETAERVFKHEKAGSFSYVHVVRLCETSEELFSSLTDKQ